MNQQNFNQTLFNNYARLLAERRYVESGSMYNRERYLANAIASITSTWEGRETEFINQEAHIHSHIQSSSNIQQELNPNIKFYNIKTYQKPTTNLSTPLLDPSTTQNDYTDKTLTIEKYPLGKDGKLIPSKVF